LLACFVLFSALAVQAQAEEQPPFIWTQTGELPIILSAPHGGTLDVPDVSVRLGEGLPRGGSGFTSARDVGTEELAKEVAATIERRFGKKPYFVIARSHRKYLDPNRPAHIAYEDPDAKPAYDAYHGTLERFCNEVRTKFQTGLLLDIHGQGKAADMVFRGTQDGKTVSLLRERYGEAAHNGKESLFAELQARGWGVLPNPLTGPEPEGYRGGYIVQNYGSPRYGIDAIQLEFGRGFRSETARAKTAATLTDAVAEYAADYLRITAPAQAAAPTAPQAGKNVVRAGKLAGCQVLIQPGGSGGGQGKALGEDGREQVRKFVKAGGGYVGICAGAYLATCDYDWSLNILDAKVLDRKHWARGFGTVDIGLSPQGAQFFGVDNPRLPIYYHQGPLLAPADNPSIEDYDGLAKFETEIAKNGAPPGVMLGCTAIASGAYHAGRVLCFSPHPERTEGLESFVARAIAWAGGYKDTAAATPATPAK
jgi:N-formylglutamate amidohydrolase